MKKKTVESIRVIFQTLQSQKNEIMTIIPFNRVDEVNGQTYVDKLYCLEQQKDYPPPPFITPDILPGYLQSCFPTARIIINPEKD